MRNLFIAGVLTCLLTGCQSTRVPFTRSQPSVTVRQSNTIIVTHGKDCLVIDCDITRRIELVRDKLGNDVANMSGEELVKELNKVMSAE